MGFWDDVKSVGSNTAESYYESARGKAGMAGYGAQIATNTVGGSLTFMWGGGYATAAMGAGHVLGAAATVAEYPDVGDTKTADWLRSGQDAAYDFSSDKMDATRELQTSAYEENLRDWENFKDQAEYEQLAREQLVAPLVAGFTGQTQEEFSARNAEIDVRQNEIARGAGTWEREEGGSPIWWEGHGAMPGLSDLTAPGKGFARAFLPKMIGKKVYGYTGLDPSQVPIGLADDFKRDWDLDIFEWEPSDEPLTKDETEFYRNWLTTAPYQEGIHPMLLKMDGVTKRDLYDRPLTAAEKASRDAYWATQRTAAGNKPLSKSEQKAKSHAKKYSAERNKYGTQDFNVGYFYNVHKEEIRSQGNDYFDNSVFRSLITGDSADSRAKAKMYSDEERMRSLTATLGEDWWVEPPDTPVAD